LLSYLIFLCTNCTNCAAAGPWSRLLHSRFVSFDVNAYRYIFGMHILLLMFCAVQKEAIVSAPTMISIFGAAFCGAVHNFLLNFDI
jgi:hypothetical protein